MKKVKIKHPTNHLEFEAIKKQVININSADRLVIPLYQRDYVWREKSVSSLFDSIYRGFPIGVIIIWIEEKTKKKHLIDGLQRTFSMIKISEKFWKYISLDLIKFILSENNSIVSDDKIIKSILKQVNSCEDKIDFDSFVKELSSTNGEHLEVVDALNSVSKFISNELPTYKVPVLEILKASREQVTSIFERLNSKGKTLNKFEVLSSKWSNHLINEENTIVKDFIVKRELEYSKAIFNLAPKAREERDKEITPADYMYAILHNAFTKSKSLRNVFLKQEDSGIEQIRNIEAVVMLFHRYVFNKTELAKLEDLGYRLSWTINTLNRNFTKEFQNNLSKALEILEEQLPLLQFAKLNSKDLNIIDSLSVSMHMIVAMLSSIMNELKTKDIKEVRNMFTIKQLQHHMITEIVDGTYSAGPNRKAIVAYSNDKYLKPISNSKKERTIKQIFSKIEEQEENRTNTSFSSFTKLLGAYVFSFEDKTEVSNLELDHAIPKSICNVDESLKGNISSIYNLSLITKHQNRQKSNSINPEFAEFDKLYEHVKDYKKLLEKIKKGQSITRSIKLILNGRKTHIDEILKNILD